MGIFDNLKGLFVSQNRQVIFWQDLDYKAKNVYLKRLAIDKVLNFVGRTFSEAVFTFKQGTEKQKTSWDYVLNVRPNKNQSASIFWKQAVYSLIFNNELLIIKTDDDQLLIADHFGKEVTAVYGTRFKDVVVNNYQFKQTFSIDDVIYLTYNNDRLQVLIDGLFEEYAEVFEALTGAVKRNNQVRGVMNINQTGSYDEEDRKKLSSQIKKMLNTFNTDSVAIAPLTNGMEYSETSSSGAQKNQPYREIDEAKEGMLGEVAQIVGVPTSLIYGDKTDLESDLKAYKRLCLNPLVESFVDELNAKLLSKSNYKQNKRLVITNVLSPDVFELAENGERLISSGVFTPNEVRELYGFDRVEGDKMMDKHYITKNYSEALEGGEASDETVKN